MERMNITLIVPGGTMVVLSGSISEKVIQSVLPKYRGDTIGSPSQHTDPGDNTVIRNKILGFTR